MTVNHFFSYKLDLYSGKAGDWLTFNRNSLTSEGKEKLGKVVAHNLRLWIEKNEGGLTSAQKAIISALAKNWVGMSDAKDDWAYWQQLAKKFPENWQDLNCSVMQVNGVKEVKTYRDSIKKDIFIDWHRDASFTIKYELPPISQVLMGTGRDHFLDDLCVQFWCAGAKHGIRYLTAQNETQIGFQNNQSQRSVLLQLIEVAEDSPKLIIDNEVLAFAIEQASKQVNNSRRLLIPLMLFPESLNMGRLILRDGIQSYGFQYVLKNLPELPMKHIVLPFEIQNSSHHGRTIQLNRLDEFVKWVNSNLKNPMSLSETKKACEELINYIDNTIMKDSAHWKSLRKTNI